MQANLVQFLEEGRLGDIILGTSMDEARALLGAPEDWTNKAMLPLTIWKYQGLQLYFGNRTAVAADVLTMIGLYFRASATPWLPPTLVIDGFFPTGRIGLRGMHRWLAQHGIDYRLDDALTFANQQTCWLVRSGAELLFDEHDKLNKILLSPHNRFTSLASSRPCTMHSA